MKSDDDNKICSYLKYKFNAYRVEQLPSNPDIYDVHTHSAYATNYNFDLIPKRSDKYPGLIEIYSIINGNGKELPPAGDKTREEYENIVFAGNPPKEVTIRKRRDILVDENGNILCNMKYPLASTTVYTINVMDFFDIDSSFVKQVFYIRGTNNKLGVSDISGNVIIPPIFASLKLYDHSSSCNVLLERPSDYPETIPFCKFYSIQNLYKTLAYYDKKQLRDIVVQLNENDEPKIQKKIFRGPVFIASDCYVNIIDVNLLTPEVWNYFKKNVDETMLVTKDNFLRIIDTMDWDKYTRMIQEYIKKQRESE